MRRTVLLTTATAVAVGTAMLLSLTPAEGTDARWRTTGTTTVSGPRSDTFDLTATDVPDPLTAAQVWPSGSRLNNTPRIDLRNTSTRHSSWIDVRSTRVTNAVPGDTNSIVSQIALEYTTGSATCETGTSTYWTARGVGSIANGTTHNRTSSKVAGATLAPGGTKTLCPLVRPNYTTATTTGARDFLRNHAGRTLDITTVVAQRSELPATWASPTRTTTSRYRVALPAPTTPSTGPVCRAESNGYGSIRWGWPDATESAMTSTPAISDWEILEWTGSSWAPAMYDFADGDPRGVTNLDPQRLGNATRGSPRLLKARGYPFAGDRSRYVESTWIARAYRVYDYYRYTWACGSASTNPDAGPHNMP